MDAQTAIKLLTARANNEAKAAREARERLIAGLQVPGSSIDHLMDAVLVADATAKPWAQLMQRIERKGVRAGLAEARAKATEALVEFGIALSTSLVTNAERLAAQDGLRRFLSGTQGMDIEDDTPEAEEASEVEAQPEPAPAPVAAPKATPAQKRTLAAIRDNGIALYWKGSKQMLTSLRGEKPRIDMVNWVIEQGWAAKGAPVALNLGHRIVLTEVGKAILAG
ncbi:hypothetical protein [Streptomyces sp. enrichment culture]|uniref:hypothetical protein n=1 Tax=Streptomyces sp. enrichment culture TaxID=1795815 RepID=UPI003F552184